MMATPKRILFVTPPGYGNIFPILSTAWALRMAGCQVLFASCGHTLDAITGGGFAVVDVTNGADLRPIYQRHKRAYYESARRAKVEAGPLPATAPLFFELSEAMLEGLTSLARQWRPHVIIHNPDAVAAPMVATQLDIPAVFLGIGIAQTPEKMFESVYTRFVKAREQHGLEKLRPSAAWIDVAPASLRTAVGHRWPMRYVPYNGGGIIGSPTSAVSERPLIVVTLGTVIPVLQGFSSLKPIIRAAADVPANFVITLGVAPRDGRSFGEHPLGATPGNVHYSRWTPLDWLLKNCSAVIHHGGAGTALTALSMGLPQMIIAQGSDQFYNARILEQRGAARSASVNELDAAMLQEFIACDRLRATAAELKAEMDGMPSPFEVASRIVALAN